MEGYRAWAYAELPPAGEAREGDTRARPGSGQLPPSNKTNNRQGQGQELRERREGRRGRRLKGQGSRPDRSKKEAEAEQKLGPKTEGHENKGGPKQSWSTGHAKTTKTGEARADKGPAPRHKHTAHAPKQTAKS